MEAAVRTSGLRKAFRGTVALHGLDLVVPTGSVFGYLGPNGAGKTTTIRLLTGLLRPTSGTAEVLGLDVANHPDEVQRRVGYLPGRFVAYPDLTGAEYLRYLAALRGGVDWSGVERLSERFDLDLGRRIGTLSHGNRQKVGLVQAFMHRPDLLVLDEPTTGLDPIMQAEFLTLVGEVSRSGATVFLSSHILSEVEAVADTVAILREGSPGPHRDHLRAAGTGGAPLGRDASPTTCRSRCCALARRSPRSGSGTVRRTWCSRGLPRRCCARSRRTAWRTSRPTRPT